jgi:hypothetical protein
MHTSFPAWFFSFSRWEKAGMGASPNPAQAGQS